MRCNIKKEGGFPPNPPSKKIINSEGFLTDNSHCEWTSYYSEYKRWEKYLKPFEEIFGVPFRFIDEPDEDYLRRKRMGLLPFIELAKDNIHPFDEINIELRGDTVRSHKGNRTK